MPLRASGQSKTLALISGKGKLPLAIAQEAKKMGYYVVGIALQPPADESLKPVTDEFHKIKIGSFGSLLSLLKKQSICEAVMAGKVSKKLLYENKKNLIPDLKAMKLLFSLKNRADDTIMVAVVKELEKEGVRIHKTTTFTRDLMAHEGLMTRAKATKDELKDIEFGWEVAKMIGKLDIGQTVVVKNGAVMAIEAIEGTDEAIKRGGELGRGEAVVVKVCKPNQDLRFDMPAIGAGTIETMSEANVRALAIEADKAVVFDKEEMIKLADQNGIAVVAIKNTENEFGF